MKTNNEKKPIRIFDIKYSIKDKEIMHSYVDQILDEAFLSNHTFCRKLEFAMHETHSKHYFISCSSATTGLEAIFRYINIKDKAVLVQSNTFIATAHAIDSAGGIIVPFDLNNEYVASFDDIKKAYFYCKEQNIEVSAVCIVNIAGRASKEIFQIKYFCEENNIFLVEDNAQGIHSKIENYFLGEVGQFSAYSFQTTKVIASGEGGLISCSKKEDERNLRNFISFGKDPNNGLNFKDQSGNFKLSELNAAMALMDLNRSGERLKRRKKIETLYKKNLISKKIFYLDHPDGNIPNFYKTILLASNNALRTEIESIFKAKNISMTGYVYKIPLNLQKRVLKLSNYINRNLPNTEKYTNCHFTPPNYPELDDCDVMRIIDTLNSIN